MITKCGDDCTYCPRFTGAQRSFLAEPEAVRDLWTRFGLQRHDLQAERMACHGCRPQNDCAYPELRGCVTSRGYANCGPCAEYPCALTKAVFSKIRDLEARAERVCTRKELELLRKAFFSKKAHLDRIHRAGPVAPSREEASA